ncbi:MAG: acyltransferase [Flavobacteriales bacterium]|nr:acyltransferase [Flavobacteriales bacterium]
MAISGVFLFHCEFGFKAGYIGVDMFFVLSGFLMGGYFDKLIDQSTLRSKISFLIRRGLRIWPLYYAVLIATGIVLGLDGRPLSFLEWSSFLLYVNNYTAYYIEELGHLWSLCIEEHFYLAIPLVVLVFTKQKLIESRALFLVIVLMGALFLKHFFSHPDAPFTSHARVYELFAGVLLYQLKPMVSLGKLYSRIIFCSLLLAAVLIMQIDLKEFLGEWTGIVLGLVFSLLILSSLQIQTPITSFFYHFSNLSYGIYLIHVPVLIFLGNGLLGIISCLILAVFCRNVIEVPFLNLRDKYLTI